MGLERDEHLHLRLFSVLVALEDICFRDTTLNVATWHQLRLILEEVKLILAAQQVPQGLKEGIPPAGRPRPASGGL